MTWNRPQTARPVTVRLPDLSRVEHLLTAEQAELWGRAAKAIEHTAECRRRHGAAVAAVDEAKRRDVQVAKEAARAGSTGPGRQQERDAREEVDHARLDLDAAVAVTAETTVALERALLDDRVRLAQIAVARLHELVDGGAGWAEVIDGSEVVLWIHDLDVRPDVRPHPERNAFKAAAGLLALGPRQVADEAIATISWLTDPPADAGEDQPHRSRPTPIAPMPGVGTLVVR